MNRKARAMRDFWDAAARQNAAWYVDTSLRYDDPDMVRFFETGRVVVAEALGRAPDQPPGHGLAVEIGSGLGRVCLALADRFERVVGIDVSPEMVRRAQELVDDRRVVFAVGSGTTIDSVADGSADLVLSFTVFQHAPSASVIRGYIAEAGRVLRPGGLLVFQWNNERGHRRWLVRRSALSILQASGLRRERYGRHTPQFLGVRVPQSTIEAALADNGLTLRKTEGLDTLFAWAWARRQG